MRWRWQAACALGLRLGVSGTKCCPCYVLLCGLQELTGKARGDLDHRLHVRALGSYVRGKLDTGDIGECMFGFEKVRVAF